MSELFDPVPDLVDRKFAADAPNKFWVADISYVLTYAGSLFLAVVLDALGRVFGWATIPLPEAHPPFDGLGRGLLR